MKQLRILFLLMISAGVLFIAGCSEDDTTDPSPTINFKGGSGYTDGDVTLTPGETFKVGITASENSSTKKNLSNFKVTRSGIVAATEVDSSISGSTFSWEKTFSAANSVGVETWTFTITDKAGETASISFVVTTEYPGFAVEKTGQMFFHIAGSLRGAFDLVGDSTMPSTGSDLYKDMKNTDVAGTTFTGSWTAGNSTTFIKNNSYDYDNATAQSAQSAFTSGGTPLGTVTNPNNGDIFIAKLRGGSSYAAIKVTSVDPNDNTCNCGNKGKITFSYKKD